MDREGQVTLLRRLAALERRVNALFRTGKVAAVQLSPYRARVDIGPDEAGRPVLTDLLPVATLRAGEVRTWTPLTVGERVSVLSPGGEDASAFVWSALTSEDFEAPSAVADEEVVRFDALGAPGTEVARIEVTRGATAAASSMELKVGLSSLTLWGDGDIMITNETSTITLDLTDLLAESPHIGLND